MQDQNETSTDAYGVPDQDDTATNRLASNDDSTRPSTNKPLSKSPLSINKLLKSSKENAHDLQSSIDTEIQKSLPTEHNDLLNHIMCKLEDKFKGYGAEIPQDMIDEIGLKLIQNYANVRLTAEDLAMSPARLRHLIQNNFLLQQYWEIAHEGIKMLTDDALIEGIRSGDKDIIRLVASRMYAGRGRGGHNITELGTIGYKDPLAKKIAAETEGDRRSQQVQVNFHFETKEIRAHQAIEAVRDDSDAIDGDFNDVENDELQ